VHRVVRRQRGTAKQRAKWKTRRWCSRSGHSAPCRYSSRGRHVTLNIGRKPKLITTTSILLGMPPPPHRTESRGRGGVAHELTIVDVDVVHHVPVLPTKRIDSCLISFALSHRVPASFTRSFHGKLGQRTTASRRFGIVGMVPGRGDSRRVKQGEERGERERERETKKRRE